MKIHVSYKQTLLVLMSIVVVTMAFLMTPKPVPPPITLQSASAGLAKPFLDEYDVWFQKKWKRETGQSITIEHTIGATGDLTRSIIDGKLEPDVMFLSNPHEVDSIVKTTEIVDPNWQQTFPYQSSPFYSTVAFLVRRGNPKKITDWSDLTRPDVSVVFSVPKTCGGGRWVYAAALGYANQNYSEKAKVDAYLSDFLNNAPILYANQGDASAAFIFQGKGDVFISYETMVLGAAQKKDAAVEIITPPQTVEIRMPVAVAIKNTQRRNTTKAATAYIRGLYEPEIQTLLAKYLFRPRVPQVSLQTSSLFPVVKLWYREQIFPTAEIENAHLGEAGIFDSLFSNEKAAKFSE